MTWNLTEALGLSANTIEIPGRYIGYIRVERSWKDWLVYLDVTNFLDKKYEKYHGRPGNERVLRVGVQRDFKGTSEEYRGKR